MTCTQGSIDKAPPDAIGGMRVSEIASYPPPGDRRTRPDNGTMIVRMFRMADDRCELLCLDLPKAERLRALRRSDGEARAVAADFRALGEPTRLTVACALRDGGELCVCDLSWIVERAENLVSHHVRALRAA